MAIMEVVRYAMVMQNQDKTFSTLSIHASIDSASEAIRKYVEKDQSSIDLRDQFRYHIERETLIEVDGSIQYPPKNERFSG